MEHSMKMLQPKELEDSRKDLTWYANSKNLFMGSKKLLELVLIRCYLIFLYCSVGFVVSKTDFSLFIYQEKEVRIYMLIYVDELLIYGNDTSMVATIIQAISKEFSIWGFLTYIAEKSWDFWFSNPMFIILNCRKIVRKNYDIF